MCVRNACGVTVPGLELTELTLEDVRKIFPAEFLAHIRGFDLCGAYGDPAAASELLQIVNYIRDCNSECSITVYSNGGLRTPGWWQELARVLQTPGLAVFAIDGLAKTNAIHRRGVVFEKVIENARAFIEAGGSARWEFLAFRHNEHEIEEARLLSETMGFQQFSVKKSCRFLEPTYDYVPEYEHHQDLNRFPIFDPSGTVVDFLEPPSDPQLVNETVLRYSDLLEHYGSLDAVFSATPINCRVLDAASVFVNAQGFAFPCCWTYVQAMRPRLAGFPPTADRQVYDLVQKTGGLESINAMQIGLQSAVESAFFEAVESSWSCSSVAEGRLKVCARACGVEFPAYFNQFSRTEFVPRGLRVINDPT
jgi:hypothetical protein